MASKKVADFLYRVERNGKAFWVARFRIDGEDYNVGLGSADRVSLREAKIKAAKAVADPPKKREKRKPNDKREVLFKDLWDTALDEIAEIKQWKRANMYPRWANSISTYALPLLG